MRCKCPRLPRELEARKGALSAGDYAPQLEPSALFGDPQVWGRQQELSWYARQRDRDTASMPAVVMLPVLLGLNVLPVEVPEYWHGSVFDDDWERT